MKKFVLAALVALCMVLPTSATASWKHGDNESAYSYKSAVIYRILETKDAYVVKYAKAGLAIGQVVVPKQWLKDRPCQLNVRFLPRQLTPYITVIKKDGSFYKVVLNIPEDKNDHIWGVLKYGSKISAEGVESVELEE